MFFKTRIKLFSLLFSIALVMFLLNLSNAVALSDELTSDEMEISRYIDIKALKSSGEGIVIYEKEIGRDEGSINMVKGKWLMYFVHWRPLDDSRKDLTLEYTKKLMLSFWGPNMPFTLNENAGEIQIAGHKGYYVEGSIYEGAVYTRFIVWNCPETNRQFIADTNINRSRKTPFEYLEIQKRMAETLNCHGAEPYKEDSSLPFKYSSDKYKIAFKYPGIWKTNEYLSKDWYPEGLSYSSGSLWTLPTDSQKYIWLLWKKKTDDLSRNQLDYFTKLLNNKSINYKGYVIAVKNFKIENIAELRAHINIKGSFDYHYSSQRGEASQNVLFKAYLWNSGDTTYFLIGGLGAVKDFWGYPVDLTPTDDQFEKFIKEEVLKNIKVLDVSSL